MREDRELIYLQFNKKMGNKNKIFGFGRLIIGNRMIRKIGLDTDICFNWISEDYSDYQPNITKKQNKLFINYKVFGELMGILIGDNKVDKEKVNEIKKKIFEFIRENRISLLKKRDINQNDVNNLFLELKNKNFTGEPGDSDLKIISIYKIYGMDGIFSNNVKHFEEPCKHLNLHFERPFMIKKGAIQDVKKMLRDLYPNKKYKRFKKK